jgi:Tol biopolymer transport system component
MNGTRVDFGTAVRDLAWKPDGSKAVFVDGDGDVVTSNPDGSGRVVVARNPGGQTWSHPTWQVRAADTQNNFPGADEIFFAARAAGVSRLYGVEATAQSGTPKPLSLNSESGEDMKPLPQTGNIWPDAAGRYGSAVYANSGTGEVFIRDDYLRQQGSAVTHGSEPALSGATEDIVFVRSVGGHDHLFLEHATGSARVEKDLTPQATTDYTEPAFSPDGRTIAARTPDGVVTLPANGSQAPVKVSDYPGLPAYRAS